MSRGLQSLLLAWVLHGASAVGADSVDMLQLKEGCGQRRDVACQRLYEYYDYRDHQDLRDHQDYQDHHHRDHQDHRDYRDYYDDQMERSVSLVGGYDHHRDHRDYYDYQMERSSHHYNYGRAPEVGLARRFSEERSMEHGYDREEYDYQRDYHLDYYRDYPHNLERDRYQRGMISDEALDLQRKLLAGQDDSDVSLAKVGASVSANETAKVKMTLGEQIEARRLKEEAAAAAAAQEKVKLGKERLTKPYVDEAKAILAKDKANERVHIGKKNTHGKGKGPGTPYAPKKIQDPYENETLEDVRMLLQDAEAKLPGQ